MMLSLNFSPKSTANSCGPMLLTLPHMYLHKFPHNLWPFTRQFSPVIYVEIPVMLIKMSTGHKNWSFATFCVQWKSTPDLEGPKCV